MLPMNFSNSIQRQVEETRQTLSKKARGELTWGKPAESQVNLLEVMVEPVKDSEYRNQQSETLLERFKAIVELLDRNDLYPVTEESGSSQENTRIRRDLESNHSYITRDTEKVERTEKTRGETV